MNRGRSSIVWLLILMFQVSCHWLNRSTEQNPTAAENGSQNAKVRVIKTTDPGKDFYIPTKLWDEVSGTELKENFVPGTNIVFIPLRVVLTNKNAAVLSHNHISYEFPKGGGLIDLATIINLDNQLDSGTFYVKFDFAGFQDGENFKVYYVSASRARRIGTDVVGAGCGAYMDVTRFVTAMNKDNGIPVNISRDQHVSALAGHFIFKYEEDKQKMVSQVSFTSTKRPDLLCEDEMEKRFRSDGAVFDQ
jgi:hypothetical protein